jgi:hypothetical protein
MFGRSLTAAPYTFFSVKSSLIQGQKFCGFRAVVAFLMTVIFMSLLQLG